MLDADRMLLEVNRSLWIDATKAHARSAAAAAATWVTDGTTDPSAYRMALEGLREGHTDGLIPPPPNLSGEYADGPTPAELVIEVTGGRAPWAGDPELPDWLADDICNCWEEEVSEVFETYCELELLKALGEDS